MDHFYITELTDRNLIIDETIIAYDDLRKVGIHYIGFDGKTHHGELIVHQTVAEEVLEIFKDIYKLGFPIEKVHPVSLYGFSDDRSMADNNSSAFNFRKVLGTNHLSWHAYGLAIDLNPQINPYILASGVVLPENGEAYVNRNQSTKGMIHEDSPIVEIFKSRGWEWGGDWDVVKDYQHFQKPMR